MTERWTLDEATLYIRTVQPQMMDAGWCLMLGGGVLNNGSGPDLDLLAYPRTLDSMIPDAIALLPEGRWSDVGVAAVYSYAAGNKVIELIFQTCCVIWPERLGDGCTHEL